MKPIKTHLTIILLLCILLPMGSIGIMTAFFTYHTLKEDRIVDAEQMAIERHQSLRRWLVEHQHHNRNLLNNLIISCRHPDNGINACAQPILKQFAAVHNGNVNLSFHSGIEHDLVQGHQAVAFTAINRHLLPEQIAITSISPKTGIVLLSIVATDSGFSLITTHPGNELQDIFSNSPILGTAGESFLTDRHGFFITQPRYLKQQGNTPLSALQMKDCSSPEKSAKLDSDYRGVPVIHGFNFVPEIGGGCIMTHIDQQEAFAPLRQLVIGFVINGVLLALLALLIANKIAKKLSSPIITLATIAQAFSRGDFKQQIRPTEFNEITYLAKCLNSMAGKVHSSIAILQISKQRLEQSLAEKIKILDELRIAATAFETQEAIIIADANKTILRTNKAFSNMYGYTEAEVLGKTPSILRSDLHDAEFYKTLWDKVKNEKCWSGEVWDKHKNGAVFPVWLTISVVSNENGGFSHYVGTISDISDYKNTQNKLLASEQRFRSYINQAADALFVHDFNGQIIDVNQQACDSLGYEREELLRMSVFDIDNNFNLIQAQTIWSQVLPSQALTLQGHHRRKNGTLFPVEVRFGCFDLEGKRQYMGLARDMSERVHLIEELEHHRHHLQKLVDERTGHLRMSEQRYRLLVDGVKDMANLMLDIYGYIITWNEGAQRLNGYTEEEIIGQHFSIFYPAEAIAAGYPAAKLQRVRAEGRVEDEGWRVRKDGSQFWAQVVITALYNEQGEKQGFSKITRDITERKQFEQALIAAKQEAEQANAAKSAFLATMSHEIRTPMNGVIGMVDVLSQTNLQGSQVEMVNTIRDSAFSLLSIIEDILDFSKIEANKLEIDSVPTSIADVVEKVCLMLDHMAIKQNVELSLFIDPKIPETVLSDPQRLRQIIVNLANNAIKFSAKPDLSGRVSVQTHLVASNAEKVEVEMRVIDNGIGMSQETQNRLFSPFTQADATTTRRFGGTGLGLSIARKLAQLMDGDISVQSTEGQGSTFTARLQFTAVQNPVADNNLLSWVKGLHCLVIGHQEGIAKHLLAYLSHAGAIVIHASHLAAAHEILATQQSTIWVWLIDNLIQPEDLHAINAENVKIILIQRGRRRQPRSRWQGVNHIVELDGNILTRQAIFQAAAIAAGSAEINPHSPQPATKNKAPLSTPSHAEARQQERLILVAEDNETNQKVILQQLALLGYAADVANDGLQALDYWREGNYALLLTDLNMPNMDGCELTRSIRAEENNLRHLPIIALTANALKSQASYCAEIGMDDYLCKPTSLEEIRVMLEKWLPHKTEHPQPASKLVVPTAESDAKKPADISFLIAQIGDNPVILNKLLKNFQFSTLKITADLQAAFQEQNPEQIAALAHKLKSSARSVGAAQLGDLCEALELAGKAQQLDVIADVFPQFVSEMATVSDYLNNLIL